MLHEFGRVVVIDIVAYESSEDLTRPWALEVAAWLRKGQDTRQRPIRGNRQDRDWRSLSFGATD
ncbi:MAG: hypothetical protein HQL03_13480 [Nitrospirae bacterium]|nr:hypothetical protein [Nitrospirota bacterium]MBF0591223.1 hypothetical protein [Nitrospirota bacterium]